MARFYGIVQGNRGEASRLGHAKDGLTVKACSYQGAIRVHVYAKGEVDMVRIEAVQHHGSDSVQGVIYDGPMMSAGGNVAQPIRPVTCKA